MRSRKPAITEEWNAVVTAKSRRATDGIFPYRYLDITLSDGATRRIRVGKALFESVAVGDAVAKKAGHEPFPAA